MKIPEIVSQICSRCIYDSRISNISFDKQGVCNYCHQVDNLADEYGTATAKGEQLLAKIIEDIRNVGKKKKYDCIIGISGGGVGDPGRGKSDGRHLHFTLRKDGELVNPMD